jgi:hypothetical protein
MPPNLLLSLLGVLQYYWPLFGADRKPPHAAASSTESTSPWNASSGHPLTPVVPLQAPPVWCDTRRRLHHCWRVLLWPHTSLSSAPTVRHHGTASVASPPLRFTSSELHTPPPHSRPLLSPAWPSASRNFGRRRYPSPWDLPPQLFEWATSPSGWASSKQTGQW